MWKGVVMGGEKGVVEYGSDGVVVSRVQEAEKSDFGFDDVIRAQFEIVDGGTGTVPGEVAPEGEHGRSVGESMESLDQRGSIGRPGGVETLRFDLEDRTRPVFVEAGSGLECQFLKTTEAQFRGALLVLGRERFENQVPGLHETEAEGAVTSTAAHETFRRRFFEVEGGLQISAEEVRKRLDFVVGRTTGDRQTAPLALEPITGGVSGPGHVVGIDDRDEAFADGL
jgi:hypothetical protein